jgi:hypothetical protein
VLARDIDRASIVNMSGLDQSSSGPDPQGTPSLSNIRNLGYNILKNLDDELVRDKEISELGPHLKLVRFSDYDKFYAIHGMSTEPNESYYALLWLSNRKMFRRISPQSEKAYNKWVSLDKENRETETINGRVYPIPMKRIIRKICQIYLISCDICAIWHNFI